MANANPSLPATAATPLALEKAPRERSSPLVKGLRTFFFHKPLGVAGAAVVLTLVFLTVLGPLVAPYRPETIFKSTAKSTAPALDCTNPDNALKRECLQAGTSSSGVAVASPLQKASPSTQHWLGTDAFARDTWTRIIYGARRSMGIGVGSLLIGTVLGVAFGSMSAFFGGIVDTLVQRLFDALQAFPAILFLLMLASVGGASNLTLLTIGIGIVATPQISRIVRGAVLQVRALPYIEAAQVVGATNRRILISHVLPNIWAPVIVIFTIGVGAAILAEAALSFLGVTPVGVSWGYTLSEGIGSIQSAPWQSIAGGAAISLAVLGFNLMGDALRDVLDPRLRT